MFAKWSQENPENLKRWEFYDPKEDDDRIWNSCHLRVIMTRKLPLTNFSPKQKLWMMLALNHWEPIFMLNKYILVHGLLNRIYYTYLHETYHMTSLLFKDFKISNEIIPESDDWKWMFISLVKLKYSSSMRGSRTDILEGLAMSKIFTLKPALSLAVILFVTFTCFSDISVWW